MELTFNLSYISRKNIDRVDSKKREQYISGARSAYPVYRNYIKPHERKNFMVSSFRVTSSELREFLENIFGIDMTTYSSNRNRLNEMIKKVVGSTKRGVKTELDFNQYKALLMLDEFNKFILDKYMKEKSVDKDRLYEELAYLQMSRESVNYILEKRKREMYMDITYALSLITGFSDILKQEYRLYLKMRDESRLHHGESSYNNKRKELLDIISGRFNELASHAYGADASLEIYKLDDYTIIDWFINDIDRWANEEM